MSSYNRGRGGEGGYQGNRGGSSSSGGGRGGYSGGGNRGGYNANSGRGGSDSNYRGRGRGGYDANFRGRGRGGFSGPPRDRSPSPGPQDPKAQVSISIDRINLRDHEKPIKGSSPFVTRPGYGTDRCYVKVIPLISNHFLLAVSKVKNTKVYHYDVEITNSEAELVESMKNANLSTGGDAGARGGGPRRVKKISKEENMDIFLELQRINPNNLFYNSVKKAPIRGVFDRQKNLYTASRLNMASGDQRVVYTVRMPDKPVTYDGNKSSIEKRGSYTVIIKEAGSDDDGRFIIELADLNAFYEGRLQDFPLDAIQALNIILRHGPATSKIAVGTNSLYPTDAKIYELGDGAVMRKGHYQSVRPCAAGLTLIVDQAATAFYPNKSALQFISKDLNKRNEELVNLFANDYSRKRLEKVLKLLHFQTFHAGHKQVYKKLTSITHKPVAEIYFERDGNTISVMAYFKDQYGKNLIKSLPCLDFGTKDRNGGFRHRYVPIEMCYLVDNQHVNGRLTGEQTRNMILDTAIPPEKRFRHIYRTEKAIKQDAQLYLAEFDLDLSTNPLRVPGKVLQTPRITYGNNRVIIPAPGSGSWNMNGVRVFQGITLSSALVINLCGPDFPAQDFTCGLADEAKKMGIQISEPNLKIVSANYNSKSDIDKYFTRAKTLNPIPKLIIWIAPRDARTDQIYAEIKQLGDTAAEKNGILTQFLDRKNAGNKAQVLANILLKINAKLGGVNQIIERADKPKTLQEAGVMVIGADVTHQAPADLTESSVSSNGIRIEYSIAALTATLDNEYFKYFTTTRVQQKEREEMITQIDEMFVEVVGAYYKNNGQLPKHIIYYRDGVSEGQFNTVLDIEIGKGIEQACAIVAAKVKQPSWKPKITLVIVQKRHHTRIRPQNPADGQGRMCNVPAGTTCDTTITHPRDFDYFLASHEGIQGTTKPAHYYVIRDDKGFSPDELYNITYFLCHTYAKCTRSISIPSPVMYAHLAAFRARCYIVAKPLAPIRLNRNATDIEIGKAKEARIDELNELTKVDEKLKLQLYFC